MNKSQQIASGLMAVLMLATIAFVPAQMHQPRSGAVNVAQAGAIGVSQVSPELPQESVRDMTYN